MYTTKYFTGDSVYFKKTKDKLWKDLGKVLGQDSQLVLLKHSSHYVRVHPCRCFLTRTINTNQASYWEILICAMNQTSKIINTSHATLPGAAFFLEMEGTCLKMFLHVQCCKISLIFKCVHVAWKEFYGHNLQLKQNIENICDKVTTEGIC